MPGDNTTHRPVAQLAGLPTARPRNYIAAISACEFRDAPPMGSHSYGGSITIIIRIPQWGLVTSTIGTLFPALKSRRGERRMYLISRAAVAFAGDFPRSVGTSPSSLRHYAEATTLFDIRLQICVIGVDAVRSGGCSGSDPRP